MLNEVGGDQYQSVLIHQLMDMKISQKKKDIKKNFLINPPQSYRQDPSNNKLKDIFQTETEAQNNDFKSHSLKNSQSIRASKLQNQDDLNNADEDGSVKPPSGHVISRENILHAGGLVS